MSDVTSNIDGMANTNVVTSPKAKQKQNTKSQLMMHNVAFEEA